MRNLSLFNKLVFVLNNLLALIMLVGFILPYIAPKKIPILSVLTLGLPILLLINLLFFIYWAIQFKKQMLLSFIILLIGLPFFKLFYKIDGLNEARLATDISILSYNVHLFNKYDWMPDKEVSKSIESFIYKVNPDIVCLQEFTPLKNNVLSRYKYKHIVVKGKTIESGLTIFSKYPIVNKGNLDFKKTFNNTIYADIKINNQLVRIYTMHLESSGIAKDISEEFNKIDENRSIRIFKKVQRTFLEQQEQAESISNHRKAIQYPVIVAGDMNNSAFSYAYNTIRGDLNDAFVVAGKGFGKSYDFKLFPFRIDYILIDKRLYLKQFKTYNEFKKSDHYPILARFSIKKEDN